MSDQGPGRGTVPLRGGWPGQGRKPWQSKPASDAPRWLLGRIGFWIALPGLDAAYQRQLLTLSRVRRAVATAATSRKRLELQIGQLERQAAEGGDQRHAGMPAELRRQYADMQVEEERLTAVSRRLQAKVNAFRAAREAIEAAYTAVEEAAEAAWAEVTGQVDADTPGAGSAAGPQN